ncbi:MAG: peptidoglycan-binding protein, partial [Acidobacteriota bacterium]|nr:peptidoglycan-binding protein [Acidobacteriota bacterium]
MSYTMAWCAAYQSTCAIQADITDVAPKEVSCGRMIELYIQLGRWQEKDCHRPQPGDTLFYDWDDSGVGDNTGAPEHVGIVVSVIGSAVRVIEGNISKKVGYRSIAVNGRYIRGYGLPDFAAKADGKQEQLIAIGRATLRQGATGSDVRYMQERLIAHGYRMSPHGADGSFGSITLAAVTAFQRANGLAVTGICDPATWAALECV